MATKPKDKALRDAGLAALCEFIKAIRATAEASGSAVVTLAASVDESLAEIEAALNDYPQSVPVTIPVTGWAESEIPENESEELDESEYLFYFDLPVEGLTARDHATVTIAPESYGAAVACGLCPTNETIDPAEGSTAGFIRLRAATVPENPITAEYWIETGKE